MSPPTPTTAFDAPESLRQIRLTIAEILKAIEGHTAAADSLQIALLSAQLVEESLVDMIELENK